MFTWTVPRAWAARGCPPPPSRSTCPSEPRGDDVAEQADDPLALGRHLHLGDRVVEEVAPIVLVGAAEVVDRPVAEELHRQQPCVSVGEHLRDVREVGHPLAVEDAVVGVGDRLVEGVLADADRREAEVELADVDRVEGRVERLGAGVHEVGFGDRVVVQAKLADEHLPGHHVLDQLVVVVVAVGGEEDVAVGALHVGAPAEHRDDAGLVAVADVVLAAVGREAALAVGLQDHVGGVDVGAVLLLREAEGEDRALVEQLRGAPADRGVGALPHRAEPEDRHLPRVPVGQPVEGGDLVEGADAGGVPALVGLVLTGL